MAIWEGGNFLFLVQYARAYKGVQDFIDLKRRSRGYGNSHEKQKALYSKNGGWSQI